MTTDITSASQRQWIELPIDALRTYMRELLLAAGADALNARRAAEVFLEADLRGNGLQGLDHMPTLLDALRDGRVNPSGRPHVLKSRAASVLIDGDRAPGQAATVLGAEVAARKARTAGCCTVAITNSFDLFMIGYYAERMARAGLVGLAFSDAPPLVRPHGGAARALGTNPLALAFPTAGADPVLVDIATSALSASRVRQSAYHDEPVPEADAVDAQGAPTSVASLVREGAIGPLAGHKGFALALGVALLAGPLTGSDTGHALRPADGSPPPSKGHLLIAIDPAAFGSPTAFESSVAAYLDEIRATPRLPGVDMIRIPGERSHACRRASVERDRAVVLERVWERMSSRAEPLGVTPPPVEAAAG